MVRKDEFVTPTELSARLGVTRKTVYRLIKRKKLRPLKVGRSIRLELNDSIRRLMEVEQ
jgi:excisionase family DNA binding protein